MISRLWSADPHLGGGGGGDGRAGRGCTAHHLLHQDVRPNMGEWELQLENLHNRN